MGSDRGSMRPGQRSISHRGYRRLVITQSRRARMKPSTGTEMRRRYGTAYMLVTGLTIPINGLDEISRL